jgi:hypothetical protein
MRAGKPGGGKGPLVKEELSLALSTQNTQTVFEKVNIYDLTHHDEVVRQVHGGNNTPIVQCLNDQGGSVMDVSDKAGTLRAQSHGHEPIVHTICGNIIGRENQNGGHQMGVGQDVSYTLNTVDRHAVCYSFDSKSSNSMKSSNPHSGCREVEVSKCLDTTTPDPSKNQGGVAIVGYRASGLQSYSEDSVAGTLRAEGGTAGGGGSETFVISEKSDV